MKVDERLHRDSFAREAVTGERSKWFNTTTAAERRQFPNCRCIRVPCCYKVQPIGLAVCLHCEASLRYAGDFEPATPDRMDAVFAAPAPTPEARAKKLAAALRMGGVYHTMSIRGEFWNMVTTALRHRASWAKRPLDKRVDLAQKGYCPWINGVGRVLSLIHI